MTPTTASQTIGPYWHLLEEKDWADLTRFGATGEKLVLEGTVFDGTGALVTDACIEIWQSSPEASDSFQGFGRCGTDAEGRFHFTTIKPGPVPGRGNTTQAPHFAITILARGILIAIHTRAYLEGEELNGSDPLLSAIEDKQQRASLIARKVADGRYDMTIHLQGPDETLFLDI